MEKSVNYDWIKVLDYDELRKVRRKYWTFVVWPDDEFNNSSVHRYEFRKRLADALDDMVIPSLISPIHDKDIKEDGTKAKPHVHVISLWENPQRYNLVLSILRDGCGLESVKYIQPVANLRAMMRYLIHLDNPDKQQYSPSDVIQVAGAQYVIEEETASDLVTAYILDNRCDSLTKLLNAFHASPSCRKAFSPIRDCS